jgi:hypothetical protein
MRQSQLMSLVEAVANVVVGYGVAVLTQILAYPGFGIETTLAQSLGIGALFTEPLRGTASASVRAPLAFSGPSQSFWRVG